MAQFSGKERRRAILRVRRPGTIDELGWSLPRDRGEEEGPTVVAGWNSFTTTGVVMGVARSADGGEIWSSTVP